MLIVRVEASDDVDRRRVREIGRIKIVNLSADTPVLDHTAPCTNDRGSLYFASNRRHRE